MILNLIILKIVPILEDSHFFHDVVLTSSPNKSAQTNAKLVFFGIKIGFDSIMPIIVS